MIIDLALNKSCATMPHYKSILYIFSLLFNENFVSKFLTSSSSVTKALSVYQNKK